MRKGNWWCRCSGRGLPAKEFPEAGVALLECRLETGRTHQIRVHVAAIGHAVVGDAAYGGQRASLPIERPFLHAAALGFDHPVTGERIEVTEPLPPALASTACTPSPPSSSGCSDAAAEHHVSVVVG